MKCKAFFSGAQYVCLHVEIDVPSSVQPNKVRSYLFFNCSVFPALYSSKYSRFRIISIPFAKLMFEKITCPFVNTHEHKNVNNDNVPLLGLFHLNGYIPFNAIALIILQEGLTI